MSLLSSVLSGFHGLLRKQDKSERHWLTLAVQQSADMIVITDTQGRILYVNAAFESLFGYLRDEVMGQSASILHNDGQSADFYGEMVRILRSGEAWKKQIVTRRKDGLIMHVDVSISPIRDREGAVIHFVGAARDITHEEALRLQGVKLRKLESMGLLAGGIAHDFNNIMTAILSYAELTLDDVPANSDAHHNLNEILVAAVRAKDLVKGLMTFSGRNDGERIPVRIGSVVREAMRLLDVLVPDGIQVIVSLSEKEWPVLADATKIYQVVMNLGTNAAQSMWETGGTLEVVLDPVQVDADWRRRPGTFPSLRPGSYMRLLVKDTGEGIAPEVIERIFEPFFTTRNPGQGSGLGLSVVHGIVVSHEGFIFVESKVGLGSSFTLFFPALLS
ncbi:MAG: PAS domain S-box protein [Magnetococcales bacterium]|nr:PAS domain S-box protein [Magnetococcales bacterium]MBF0437946.1 PAS domain S-box protein [Magnetococcales bacterium]